MSYSSRSQKCKMSLSELIHGVSRVGLLSEAPGNSISLPFPAPKVALFLPLGPLPRKQQQGISFDSFSIMTTVMKGSLLLRSHVIRLGPSG